MIHGALRDGRRRAANAPATKFSFICSRPTAWQTRAFATPAGQGSATTKPPPTFYRKRKVIKQIDETRKSGAIEFKNKEFLLRLDRCLPLHLRSNPDHTFATDRQEFTPKVSKTAAFVLEANEHFNGFLPWLAVKQGRWKAAVWIVKLLLERYHAEPQGSNRISHLVQQWNRTGTLDDLLTEPLYLVPEPGQVQTPHIKPLSAPSLDYLTQNKPAGLTSVENKRHDILGVIWHGIGRLIISCANDPSIAGGEVKPEILEMIALLHHYEFMPSSIYNYVPSESRDAIQQPPTLHLLSSRIMTALSDAAWRAREMTAFEEAKRKGSNPLGVEAKGSAYRVRVSGIKPEVWLELILWSCLHGGWVVDGASLLSSFVKSKDAEQWKPISWRDALGAIMPFGQKNLLDWDSIKYMFDTRSTATMDNVDVTGLRVEKTVSSEVVNAYIDALLNAVSVDSGERGMLLSVVTRSLRDLQKFLQRADLNLGGGSWDAMLLRLVESGGLDIERNPSIVRRLVELSPRIGEELKSRRSQVLPSYVLDGSATLLGLLHRALHAQIRNGNLEGALEVFKLLQERVDDDRHRSLGDFFKQMHLNSSKPGFSSSGLFTSNFTGIDYPSFDTQIPPTTLAAFLELVTESKAFDFGRWMLYNQDIDGPIISDGLYSEPAISAAVVRFATAVDDKDLLTKVTKLGAVESTEGRPSVPSTLLQAFFDTQIELRRWQSALRILEHMRDSEGYHWHIANVASVAKIMILESRPGGAATDDFKRAQAFFQAMLSGRFGTAHISDPVAANKFNTLSIVLATIDAPLAAAFRQQRQFPKHLMFTLSATPFNKMLEAVGQSYGSKAARALLERFTPELSSLQRGKDGKLHQIVQTLPRSMPPFMRDAITAERLSRTTVTLADADATRVAVYGKFKFGVVTMQIICRQALSELRERGDVAAEEDLEIFVWALTMLRKSKIDAKPVWDELRSGGLSEGDLKAVWEALKKSKGRLAGEETSEGFDEGETAPESVEIDPEIEAEVETNKVETDVNTVETEVEAKVETVQEKKEQETDAPRA